jgi:hypothetical protein
VPRTSPIHRLVGIVAWLLAGAALAAAAVLLAERTGYPILKTLQAVASRAKVKIDAELSGWPEALEIERTEIGPPRVAKIIYLNREGAKLRGGRDHAPSNTSSIVASVGLGEVLVPAFSGSNSRWNEIVACVRAKFAPYDVEITDRRPVDGDRYIMAVLGGEARILGKTNKHVHALGLSPFNGEPIEDAVVMVFSGAMKNALRATCEAAAMELAHAYGLDHAHNCLDVMTYLPYCGPKSFLDRDLRCGEKVERNCHRGAATQNAHQWLLRLLGPRPS